jgi:hypothetical protein
MTLRSTNTPGISMSVFSALDKEGDCYSHNSSDEMDMD